MTHKELNVNKYIQIRYFKILINIFYQFYKLLYIFPHLLKINMYFILNLIIFFGIHLIINCFNKVYTYM